MVINRRVKDIAERVIFTFVGAFAAVYIAAFAAGQADVAFLRDPGLFQKAQAAGIVAALALGKNLVGLKVGDKNTGSVIPSNKPEDVDPFIYQYLDNPTKEG